jgi:hypothetical protein
MRYIDFRLLINPTARKYFDGLLSTPVGNETVKSLFLSVRWSTNTQYFDVYDWHRMSTVIDHVAMADLINTRIPYVDGDAVAEPEPEPVMCDVSTPRDIIYSFCKYAGVSRQPERMPIVKQFIKQNKL